LDSSRKSIKDEGWIDNTVKEGHLIDKARGMLERNWVLLGALLLCTCLPASFVSSAIKSQGLTGYPAPDGFWGAAIGFAVASGSFIWISFRLRKNTLQYMSQIVPLVCIGSMLLIWMLGYWATRSGEPFSNIPMGLTLATLSTLLLLQLSAGRPSGLKPQFVFGVASASCAVVFLIVFVLRPLVGDVTMGSLQIILWIVYLILVAVNMIIVLQRSPAQPSLAVIEERCRHVGVEYALSNREIEIVLLLAQGRNVPYIAGELFVSGNTVKSHMKRIYAKCNIHSKEELLDLIYASNR
jgi:DNA-binding CsgD family transcriptional regulator